MREVNNMRGISNMKKLIASLICSCFLIVNSLAEPLGINPPVDPVIKSDPVLATAPVGNEQTPVATPAPAQVVPAVTPEVVASQELTGRLTVLESKIGLIETQLVKLNEQLASIEKSLNDFNKFEQNISKSQVYKFFTFIDQSIMQLETYLGPHLFKAVVGGVVILLFLLLLALFSSHKHNEEDEKLEHSDNPNINHDLNSNSEEENNANKLNLARAYIGMGEEEKAKETLQEVLSHGSDAEQEEAHTLLAELKQKRL